MSLAESIGTGFIRAFETLGVDPQLAQRGSAKYSSVDSWIGSQVAQTAAVGGAAMAIPGAHHIASAADLAVVVHKIAVMSWGVGYKLGCTVDPQLDLANVLAVWAGLVPHHVLVTAGTAAAAAGGIAAGVYLYGGASAMAATVGTNFAAKVAATVASAGTTAVLNKVGAKGAAKVGGKAAGKLASAVMKAAAPRIGTKIAAKMGAKQVIGWVPILGMMAGAGINVWIMTSISRAAVTYFDAKKLAESAC